MALKFAKAGSASAQDKAPESKSDAAPSTATKTTTSQQQSKPSSSGKPSFLMKGQQAKQAMAVADAKQEAAMNASGKLRDFWMGVDEERKITFLDGELDETGMLDINMVNRHLIKKNGQMHDFICTSDTEGHCPICEEGESKPTLVGLMTIINHTPYTIASGQNAGKVLKDRKMLYICTRETIKLLTKQAIKRGGLTGCTYEASRTGDKKPRVGDVYEFVSKRSLSEIQKECKLDDADMQPADYGEEMTYVSPEKIVELGFGKMPTGPGYEKSSIDKSQIEDQL